MAKRAECEYTIFCIRLKKRKKMLLKCLNGTLKFVGIDKVRARLRLNSNMHMQWFQVASLLMVCTIVHSIQFIVKCVHRVYIALHWRQTGWSARTENSVPINWKNFPIYLVVVVVDVWLLFQSSILGIVYTLPSYPRWTLCCLQLVWIISFSCPLYQIADKQCIER